MPSAAGTCAGSLAGLPAGVRPRGWWLLVAAVALGLCPSPAHMGSTPCQLAQTLTSASGKVLVVSPSWCDLYGGGTSWRWPRCDPVQAPAQGCGSPGQHHGAKSCPCGCCGAGLCPVSPMSSTKQWPHWGDPPPRGPAPPLPLRGRGFQGSPWQGCSRPHCADEGILARAGSRKSFQDLLGQCQLAGSCPARAGLSVGGTRSPHSPGQDNSRAASGWGGSFCTPDPWLDPIAALLEAVWAGMGTGNLISAG